MKIRVHIAAAAIVIIITLTDMAPAQDLPLRVAAEKLGSRSERQ
jgi:hypothetical protein